ncbi:hypothetical protein [Methanobrevibacter sp.]|uniref:hypothetical protein n=1 Tax=Methanobrevibacter sp. TaxID=66852 RepID=UPI00388D2ADB
MKRIILISTFILVLLIAIGCAAAADVDGNDKNICHEELIVNAPFNDHGVAVGDDAGLLDDSGVIDNGTDVPVVPGGSDVVDNESAVPDYFDKVDNGSDVPVVPGGSDVVDNESVVPVVPGGCDVVDNKTAPDNGNSSNHSDDGFSKKDFNVSFDDDVKAGNSELYLRGINFKNPDFTITNLNLDDSGLSIEDITIFNSFLELQDFDVNVTNLQIVLPHVIFFNFCGGYSLRNMILNHMGGEDFNLGQSPIYNENLLFEGN